MSADEKKVTPYGEANDLIREIICTADDPVWAAAILRGYVYDAERRALRPMKRVPQQQVRHVSR